MATRSRKKISKMNITEVQREMEELRSKDQQHSKRYEQLYSQEETLNRC